MTEIETIKTIDVQRGGRSRDDIGGRFAPSRTTEQVKTILGNGGSLSDKGTMLKFKCAPPAEVKPFEQVYHVGSE